MLLAKDSKYIIKFYSTVRFIAFSPEILFLFYQCLLSGLNLKMFIVYKKHLLCICQLIVRLLMLEIYCKIELILVTRVLTFERSKKKLKQGVDFVKHKSEAQEHLHFTPNF